MKLVKPNKNFISDVDKFLQQFDAQHPQLSLSQRHEIEKYERINRLRDQVTAMENTGEVWEGF